MFQRYGTVSYVRLIANSKSKNSKGIAFVQMPVKKDADKAIEALNEHLIDGRTLKVSIALDKISSS